MEKADGHGRAFPLRLSHHLMAIASSLSLSFLAEWSHLKVDDPSVHPKCHSNLVSLARPMDLKRLSFLLGGGGFGHKREGANDTMVVGQRTSRLSRSPITGRPIGHCEFHDVISPPRTHEWCEHQARRRLRPTLLLHHCRGPSNRLRLSPTESRGRRSHLELISDL